MVRAARDSRLYGSDDRHGLSDSSSENHSSSKKRLRKDDHKGTSKRANHSRHAGRDSLAIAAAGGGLSASRRL